MFNAYLSRSCIRYFFVAMILFAAPAAVTCQLSTVDAHSNRANTALLAKKIFPFFIAVSTNPSVRELLENDAVLRQLSTHRQQRLKNALQYCAEPGCFADSIKWNEADRTQTGNRLVELFANDFSFRNLMSELRRKNFYSATAVDQDSGFVRSAWNSSVTALNYIFDVYLAGRPPVYVKIDSISFQKNDPLFASAVQQLLAGASKRNKDDKIIWSSSMATAITLLQLNGRDEAARYEPLNSGYNKAPFKNIKKINWSKYTYSMILVPGLGPEQPGVAIDPGGIKRCIAGAAAYRDGLAPFIVVSGGHVHPFKTPFNEAVEMKNYLVNELGIPERAVFIEPHARHTTTNLRNANRMVYRFGMDESKPILIVTDASQAAYITGGMAKTSMRDLGYLPYRDVKSLGNGRVVYYPVFDSFFRNPKEPLDP